MKKYIYTAAILVWSLGQIFAQTIETFETETPGGTTFSEGSVPFNLTGNLLIESATGFGCCPSNRFMGTGTNNGGSTGSVGQAKVSIQGKGFQLQELDAWTSNNDGLDFAVGNVTFIGTRPNGTTISYTTEVNPTGDSGTDFEHLNFAGTPLEGITLINLEIQLAPNLNYIAIDNFKFLAVNVPFIFINNASTTEGNSGTKTLTFAVTLANSSASSFTVDYATADNTATTANLDYVSASGTITFAGFSGEIQTILVTLNGDNTPELDETFFVNLTNVSLPNVNIFDGQGIGTIQNDEGAVLAIAAANAVKIEGNSGTTPFFFTVNRTGDLSGASTVNYTVSGNGAAPANAADFGGSFPGGTVSFNPLEASRQIQINVSGDLTDENNEGFAVTLSGASSGSIITTASATGSIIDDEMHLETFEGEFAPGSAFSENGNMFTATAPLRVFNVTGIGCCPSNYYLDNISTSAGSFTFTNSNIGGFILQEMDVWTSANGGSNFAVGNLTFTGTRPNGTTVSHTLTITPTGDTGADFDHKSFAGTPLANEVLRSLTITPASPINYFQIDNLKYGLGSQGMLSINDATLTEGNSGAQNLQFTVTHTGSSGAFTVNYATANNSALSGSDYTATSGTLSFNGTNGETQTITVPVLGDATVELNEIFDVNLSSISSPAVTLVDGQGTGTITNDDAAVISINFVSLNEGDAGTKSFNFAVTLNEAVNTALTVDFATDPNTATAGTDYLSGNGTLTFNGTAGETKAASVLVNGDTDYEGDETFFVNLSNVQANGRNVTLSSVPGQGVILNDDPLPVPEMNVFGNNNPIDDNATTTSPNNNTDFGVACINSYDVFKTFVIQNSGTANLEMNNSPRVSLTGDTDDFSVVFQPQSPLLSMAFTTFEIIFHPTTLGLHSATVWIENNDPDEDPYNFVVQGTANPAASAAFAYASSGYCQADADPTPTIYGTTGGTFSAQAQILINTDNGEIDVSASTPGGPYTVTYTTPGPCTLTATAEVYIVDCMLTASLTDDLIIDNGSIGLADPGDRIKLTATINNSQQADYRDVKLTLNNDPRVTLVPGSIKTSPVAVDDTYLATKNTTLTVPAPSGLLANDFDDNIPGLNVTAFSMTSAQGGTVSVNTNGSFTYMPPNGFSGNDSFTYTITDSNTQTNSGTVHLIVQ